MLYGFCTDTNTDSPLTTEDSFLRLCNSTSFGINLRLPTSSLRIVMFTFCGGVYHGEVVLTHLKSPLGSLALYCGGVTAVTCMYHVGEP